MQKFLLQSDAQGKVHLRLEGAETAWEFADMLAAISAARALSKDGKAQLIAYDASGAVVFETMV